MNPRVLLVRPPELRYKNSSQVFGVGVPIGLLSVAAAVRDQCELRVFDCTITDLEIATEGRVTRYGTPHGKIAEIVSEFRPEVVGITIPFSSQEASGLEVGRICKELDPDITVVFGGPHPSVRYESLIREPCCDYCVVGEGEESFSELLRKLGAGQSPDVAGVAWTDGRSVHFTPPDPIADLNGLAIPAYDMVDMEAYLQSPYLHRNREFESLRPRQISVITSRGCPFRCVFCSIKLHMGRRFRACSPDYVIRHLKHLIETYGIRDFKFEDDNISLDRKRFEAILDWIVQSGQDIQWSIPNGIRADTLDPDLLKKIRESGCQRLRIAIESGSQRVLDEVIHKGARLEKMVRVARWAHELGMPQASFYVIGFPGETLPEMRKTMDLAVSLFEECDLAPSLFSATPLFGTELYDICVSNGYIKPELTDEDFSTATHTNAVPLIETPEFSAEQVMEILDEYRQRRKEIANARRSSAERIRDAVQRPLKAIAKIAAGGNPKAGVVAIATPKTVSVRMCDYGVSRSADTERTAPKRLNLLYLPGFTSKADFHDHYCRMLWYLSPMLDYLGDVYVATSFLPDDEFSIPDYLDPEIRKLSGRFEGKLIRLDFDDRSAWEQCIQRADILMHWNLKDIHPDKEIARLLKKAMKKKQRCRIDHGNEQYAGSIYLKLSQDSNPAFEDDLADSQRKFAEMVREIGTCQKVYVFGTGPSLEEAMEMDFSDGITIACNSMVKNRQLLTKLKPRIFTIGDPIFHAGCSSYAGLFRKHLVEVLDEYGCYLIVPFRDYVVYMAHMPQRFHRKIIGMPMDRLDGVNLDLAQHHTVCVTPNILTAFMIPVACTLANQVGIAGCDGRKLEDNKHFWSHHKASQLNSQMESIKLAHPAFFNLNYNEYYLKHCETLEQWFRAGEEKGVTFVNLTPSYIPALQKRSGSPALKDTTERNDKIETKQQNPLVSVIMPVFNGAKTIVRAVRSLQADAYQNWELLVIDDHSTDDTAKLVTEMARSDPRIKYLRNPRKGVSSARNQGIKEASGSLIAFLDADDVYCSDSLASRVCCLQEHSEYQAVYCPIIMMDDELRELWRLQALPVVRFEDMYTSRLHVNSVMLHADLARQYHFDETLENGEDWLFFTQIARGGTEFHLADSGSAGYVMHRQSTVLHDILGHENRLLDVLSIIYGEDSNCPNVSEKYRKGLVKPAKDRIILHRRFRLMLELIFSGAEKDAKTVAEELKDNIRKISATDAAGVARIAVMRHEICDETAWPLHWRRRAADVDSFLAANFPAASITRLRKDLSRYVEDLARKDAPATTNDRPREESLSMEELRFVHQYLESPARAAVMIDVGAHFGGSCRMFLHDGWKVFAFEPDSNNRQRLMKLAKEYPALSIDPRAVSGRVQTNVPFYTSDVSTGISGLHSFHDSHKETSHVDTTTLTEFCQSEGIADLDLLKIDTEGFDLFVLEGFPWQELQPKVVVCEFEDRKSKSLGYDFHKLAGFLVDKGYELIVSEWYPIVEYGAAHRWRRFIRYPCELEDPDAWGNIIAFHNGVDWPRLLSGLGRIAARRQLRVNNRDRAIANLKQQLADGSAAKTAPQKASSKVRPRISQRPVTRWPRMVKSIIKWHLRWGGVGLLAAMALFAWAFTGRPYGLWAGLAGIAVIFATIAYTFVRAMSEARDQAAGQRKRVSTILQNQLDSLRNWTGQEISRRDREIRATADQLTEAIETKAVELRSALKDEKRQREQAIETKAGEFQDAMEAEKRRRAEEIAAKAVELRAALKAEKRQRAEEIEAKAVELRAALKNEKRQRAEEIEVKASELRAVTEALRERHDEAVESATRQIRRALEGVKASGAAIDEVETGLDAERRERIENAEAVSLTLEKLNETLSSEKRRREQEFRAEVKRVEAQAVEQAEHLNAVLKDQASQLDAAVKAEAGRLDAVIRTESETRRKAFATRDRKAYQSFRRRLSREDEKRLLEVWAKRLNVEPTINQVRYWQERITFVEDMCEGRLAGHVQDAILRAMVGLSIGGRQLDYLEIGALFGVSAICLYDVLRNCYRKISMTLIDPLEGYYGHDDLDVGTGLPVTSTILRRNFDTAGISRRNWNLIRAYSTDKKAVEEASQKRYHLIFVDGDHSYEGVERDFVLYSPFLAPNGYIIFDDYKEEHWPDVARFVDDVVMHSPDFECVGADWRSAVFRRKADN